MSVIKTKRRRGFSLIEVLVVVAILAILASIGWPAYQEYVLRARRADAKADLLELTQCMERFNTSNSTYVGGPARCAPPNSEFYTLSYADVARSTFTLNAAPKETQSSDACGQLGINQSGAKTHGGSEADKCW